MEMENGKHQTNEGNVYRMNWTKQTEKNNEDGEKWNVAKGATKFNGK